MSYLSTFIFLFVFHVFDNQFVIRRSVSEIKKCRNYRDIVPLPRAGCVVDSFRITRHSGGKRDCYFPNHINLGEKFDSVTIELVKQAKPGFEYWFAPITLDCGGKSKKINHSFRVQVIPD